MKDIPFSDHHGGEASGPPWDLLDRYFSGEATPEEHRMVNVWSRGSVAATDELTRLRRMWQLSADVRAHVTSPDVYAAFAQVRTRIGTEWTPAAAAGIPAAERSRKSPWAFQLAALACAAVAVVVGLWIGHPEQRIGSPLPFGSVLSYVTGYGKRAGIELSDGTQVTLNAASTLTLAEAFGQARRDVMLDGEAAFVVTHAQGTPFVVGARNLRAVVLGTTFNVRAYETDVTTRIAVLDGRVSVGDAVLSFGDIGEIGKGMPFRVVSNQDVAMSMAWTRGNLTFTQAPLPMVLSDLRRTYDAEILVADSVLNKLTLTGTFTGRTIDDLATTLDYILNVRVTRRGRSLVLHQR